MVSAGGDFTMRPPPTPFTKSIAGEEPRSAEHVLLRNARSPSNQRDDRARESGRSAMREE